MYKKIILNKCFIATKLILINLLFCLCGLNILFIYGFIKEDKFLLKDNLFTLSMILIAIFIILSLGILITCLLNKFNTHTIKYSLISFLLYVAIIISLNEFALYKYSIFSAEKWNDFPNRRFLMVNDLKENYLTKGIEYDDVKDLIGKESKLYENIVNIDSDISFCCSYLTSKNSYDQLSYMDLYFDSHRRLLKCEVVKIK